MSVVNLAESYSHYAIVREKMMNKIKILSLLPGLCLASTFALAQDVEAPERYTYATYLKCDTSNEGAVDEYVAKYEVPVLDKLVDDGVINGWGWLRHHTGGEWRRIRWVGTDSIDAAVASMGNFAEAMQKAYGEDGPDMGGSCSTHDDYIWKVEAGTAGKDRGEVGISVYFSCKITEEARADEIVKENFAPVYDKMVEDGKLASWGWQSHVVGGWFRRLHTLTAADFETLMAARAEALEITYAEDNEAGAEFAGICGGHQDYLWGIVHEKQASN